MIAQIKLLQLASNNYSFTQDSHFREWFAGVEKLSEAERSVGRRRHVHRTDRRLSAGRPAHFLFLQLQPVLRDRASVGVGQQHAPSQEERRDHETLERVSVGHTRVLTSHTKVCDGRCESSGKNVSEH